MKRAHDSWKKSGIGIGKKKKWQRDWQDDFPLFLPMQNHGPHEHRQVDQSRQGHGSDVANCGTQTSRLGRFARLAKHDDLTRKKTKTKKCVCLTHLPHTICNKPRSGPPRVCLETVWSENQLKLWQCLHPLPAEQSGGQAPPRRSAADPPGEWEQTFRISGEQFWMLNYSEAKLRVSTTGKLQDTKIERIYIQSLFDYCYWLEAVINFFKKWEKYY